MLFNSRFPSSIHTSIFQGLTPELYWQNHAQIISSSRATLPSLISSLVASTGLQTVHVTGSPIIVPVTRVKSRLAVGKAGPIPLPPSSPLGQKACVFISSQPSILSPASSHNSLFLQTPSGKKGQHKFLTQILPQSLDFLKHHLVSGEDVAVLCDDGKDISIGVAVAALTLFFDDEGICIADTTKTAETGTLATLLMILK